MMTGSGQVRLNTKPDNAMETVTTFELNAMYADVSHKLGRIWFNEKSITWQQWTERCSELEDDTPVSFQLRPQDKALHITLKTLPANPFLQA